MEIIKAIKLTEDNIQEIWECPAVYRISKLQLDLLNGVKRGLEKDDRPFTQIWITGSEFPCATRDGYLVLDELGYWRFLSSEDYQELSKGNM